MPLDEVGMLGYFDCLDASGIEQGDWISCPDVDDGGNYATDVCANFDDAIHTMDFSETFNRSLNRLAMGVDEVEFALVFGYLLGVAMGVDFCYVVLSNKGQNCDGVSLVIEGFKIIAQKIGRKEGSSKILGDVVHRFPGSERAQPFG